MLRDLDSMKIRFKQDFRPIPGFQTCMCKRGIKCTHFRGIGMLPNQVNKFF